MKAICRQYTYFANHANFHSDFHRLTNSPPEVSLFIVIIIIIHINMQQFSANIINKRVGLYILKQRVFLNVLNIIISNTVVVVGGQFLNPQKESTQSCNSEGYNIAVTPPVHLTRYCKQIYLLQHGRLCV